MSVELLPQVTVSDLREFRVAAPGIVTQPVGSAVVGVPFNLAADMPVQYLSGDVLGRPVTVRFLPHTLHVDYGDGTVVAVSPADAVSWQALGVAAFTPTPGTHVYRAPGRHLLHVDAEYGAEVDFGAGNWLPVLGTVTVDAGTHPIDVARLRNALVARTCDEAPHGPGCGSHATGPR